MTEPNTELPPSAEDFRDDIAQVLAEQWNNVRDPDHHIAAYDMQGEARAVYEEVVAPALDTLRWLHAEAVWLKDGYRREVDAFYEKLPAERAELAAWRSGARRHAWPVVESAPDGITYAAHLARAQGTEGGEEHDQLLREASQRMKALYDTAQTLLQERAVLSWLHAEAIWHAEHHRAQAAADLQRIAVAMHLKPTAGVDSIVHWAENHVDSIRNLALDRDKVREALLPILREHPLSKDDVQGDNLKAGYIAKSAADVLRWYGYEMQRWEATFGKNALTHATAIIEERDSLRADKEIRQGALNDVLGHPREADYYSAVEDVAQFRKGARSLLDQVEAMGRELERLQASRFAWAREADRQEQRADFVDELMTGTIKVMEREQAEANLATETLGAIWSYVDWRYVTGKLTTEQRELWADAVDAFGGGPENGKAERWWREDAAAPKPKKNDGLWQQIWDALDSTRPGDICPALLDDYADLACAAVQGWLGEQEARRATSEARPRPPFPYEARQWMEDGARVECFSGRDASEVVHEGWIIGMTEAPTVRVQKDDGRIISWVLGITRRQDAEAAGRSEATRPPFGPGDLVRWNGDTGWFAGRIVGPTPKEIRRAAGCFPADDTWWDMTVTDLGTFYEDKPSQLGATVHITEERIERIAEVSASPREEGDRRG